MYLKTGRYNSYLLKDDWTNHEININHISMKTGH